MVNIHVITYLSFIVPWTLPSLIKPVAPSNSSLSELPFPSSYAFLISATSPASDCSPFLAITFFLIQFMLYYETCCFHMKWHLREVINMGEDTCFHSSVSELCFYLCTVYSYSQSLQNILKMKNEYRSLKWCWQLKFILNIHDHFYMWEDFYTCASFIIWRSTHCMILLIFYKEKKKQKEKLNQNEQPLLNAKSFI